MRDIRAQFRPLVSPTLAGKRVLYRNNKANDNVIVKPIYFLLPTALNLRGLLHYTGYVDHFVCRYLSDSISICGLFY